MTIITFEEYTSPLTEAELHLVDRVGELLLSNAFGRKNSKTSSWIASKLKNDETFAMKPKHIHGATIRKIVHRLRVTTLPHLCATGKGYFIASSEQELRDWSESLAQRIKSISDVYRSAKRAQRRQDIFNHDKSTKQCFIPFT